MNIDIKKDPEKGPFCIDFNNLGYIEAKKNGSCTLPLQSVKMLSGGYTL